MMGRTVSRRNVLGGIAVTVGTSYAVGALAQTVSAPASATLGLDGLPTTIAIDHFSLGVANLVEGVQRLRAETGFGSLDGSWFPGTGIANTYVPLGGDTYLEVESCIDAHAKDPASRWFVDQTAAGDTYLGWSVRVSSRTEIERIAKRLGTKVEEGTLAVRPDGSRPAAIRTPDSFTAWSQGLPSIFCYPDLTGHVSRKPTTIAGKLQPQGLAWVELGGTADAMSRWLGVDVRALPIRFVEGSPGLRAIGVHAGGGIVEIRRKPISI